MQKAKNISQIYEEVKDMDIVITNDPALKDGLNQRVKKPILGQFCYTPKELATEFSSYLFDLPLESADNIILKIAKKENISIKQAHHIVSRIFELWEKTGSIKSASSFLQLHEKKIADMIQSFPNIYSAMENFFFDKLVGQKNTAVVGYEWLNTLDTKTLPQKFTKIDILLKEKIEMSEFYVFESEKEVLSKLSDMITLENQDDVAIIVPSESKYSVVAKSHLANNGIKIRTGSLLRNEINTRIFLGLIELGLGISNAQLKDAMPYFEIFDRNIDEKYCNYQLSYYIKRKNKNEEIDFLFSFLSKIQDKTYSEVITLFKEKINFHNELMNSLKNINLINEKISLDNFQELLYYIDNFDKSVSDEKQGVLFVDANSSAFVNRPLCFFLGMDNEWNPKLISKESIDFEKEEKKNIEKFQVLLQQGSQQFYMVSEFASDNITIPCYYFNIIHNRIAGSFADSLFRQIKIKTKNPQVNYPLREDKSNKKNDEKKLEFFSQSSFNNFVTCPKKYSYSKILPSEDQTYFLKGTLIHEFAEFCFEYPEFVKEKGPEEFAAIMVTQYKRMAGDLNLDYEKSIFLIAVKNIISFIDSIIVHPITLPFLISGKKSDNIFARKFTMELKSKNAEAEFTDDEFGIKGIIDLIITPEKIVDYKTSAYIKNPKDIIKCSNLDIIQDSVDFQPFFYIMELRKHSADKEIRFVYNFVLANKDDVVEGGQEQKKNIVEICYFPKTFSEFLCSPKAVAILAGSKERLSFITSLGGPKILTDFFKANPISKDIQYDEQKMLNSDYAEKFRKMSEKILGSKYCMFESSAESLLKSIVCIRTGERQKEALIFKEDIDEFARFINQKKEEVNVFINSQFPFLPMTEDTCNSCEFKDICLRWIQDDK